MNGIFIAFYALGVVLWGVSFLPRLGFRRSTLLSLCRGLWVLPLVLALTPRSESRELPRTLERSPIYVLVDDSSSMQDEHDGQVPSKLTQNLLTRLRKSCQQLGCELKETLLSQENSLTKRGYTPLRQALATWFARLGHESWLVISDGGDAQPSARWPSTWQGFGTDVTQKQRGMLVGFSENSRDRLWIENLSVAPLSFDGRPSTCEVTLHRKRRQLALENVQVQVSLGEQVLLSENVIFPEGQESLVSTLPLPALPRGQHEIEVRVLAPRGETVLWDKMAYASIDVVSNTLGILHLLGSPSWDGRFLRRYLKSEPKYDLISFFILRDPWDVQDVNERELSLIPFPVSRLFSEELVNFRAIVLQNFNLLQFLMPSYQKNLVEFVKAGGGLFFIGGRRALQSHDLQNSPLRELLPFDLTTTQDDVGLGLWEDSEASVDKNGPWYDKNLSYTIALAHPNPGKLALADVFEEWALFAEQLGQVPALKGLHHMENVKFKSDYTPLLDATTADGKKIPLAVASYPGKGRAIWLFTDQLWHLALNPQAQISRTVYNHLMESTFAWLLRQDFRKPLSASRFQLQAWGENEPVDWSVWLQGPAVHYFEPDSHWHLKVCNNTVDLQNVFITKTGPTQAILSGKIENQLVKAKTCRLEIRAEHPAFGSLVEAQTAEIPEMIKDQGVGASELKMQQLAELTGAKVMWLNDFATTAQQIETWMEERTGHNGVFLPPRYRTLTNHYWIFDSWWFFFLLLFLPLEVVVRRWDNLTP